MRASDRSYERLTAEHLGRLSALAAEDRDMFFNKQPTFRDRHIATVLAQGAALHWLDGRTGVKDLDVWSFFALGRGGDRFPASIRNLHVDFGPSDLGRQTYDLADAKSDRERNKFRQWSSFRGRRVDLMLRGLPCRPGDDPASAIRAWLRSGRRQADGSPWWLAQKAVILIDPVDRRGEQVWPEHG